MKIQAIDNVTKKPLLNFKLQIQVRGKDSGYLTLTTDGNGYFTLDDKYKNQQITFANGGAQGQWVSANEGVKLFVTQGTQVGGGRPTTTTK